MACGCPSLVMPDGGPAEVCREHPLWVADANTDEAFEQLVRRYLSARGNQPRRATGIAEEAGRLYSNDAIRQKVLQLAEECAAGGV